MTKPRTTLAAGVIALAGLLAVAPGVIAQGGASAPAQKPAAHKHGGFSLKRALKVRHHKGTGAAKAPRTKKSSSKSGSK